MAAKIQAVVGDEIQVVPRMNFNPATPVSVDIYPGDAFFRDPESAGFGDVDGSLIFTVRARVADNDIDGAQDQLLHLMDDEHATSVAVALYADRTLDGKVSSLFVEGPTGYRGYEDNPGAMLGVQWRVRVLNNAAVPVGLYGDDTYGEGLYGD